jgi:hypothetical protein
MKKLLYIPVVLALIFSSCENVLDKAPLDIISDDVVWNDPVLVEAYIAQVYGEMNFLAWRNNQDINILSQLSDESRGGYEWRLIYLNWKPGLLNENGGLEEYWGYSTIRKMNEFLQLIETSILPEADKKVMTAKMRFARAFAYFDMVKRYGGIPLITVPQAIDAPTEELFVPRDKEVDVYDFIIDEMDAITDDLPESYSNSESGWPTKYAALALKSRAAMYAASIATWGEVEINGLVGIPVSEAQRFWQASYDASKTIIETGIFQLYNKQPGNKTENFRQLFLDENNSEVIFAKQYTGIGGVAHSWDQQEFPGQASAYSGSSTAVYLEMVESFENIDGSPGTMDRVAISATTWNLGDLFVNKDPRFHASIFFEGNTWQDDSLENWRGLITPAGDTIIDGFYSGIAAQGRNYTTSQGALATGFGVKKYCDETKIGPRPNEASTDFMVFRLGEILLNYAEAAFELNKTDEALSAVNQLRERAGIALLGSIDRDKIRNERKVELFSENQRYWDLKRWRTAVSAISRPFTGIATLYDVNSGKFVVEFLDNIDGQNQASFEDKHYYLPITPTRIANNPSLAPENPGY